MSELSNMTDEQLEIMEQQARSEAARRRMLRDMPAQVEQMLQQFQGALGRSGGDPWETPVTVMHSYPDGAVVTHGGKLYESRKHLNMAEPGKDIEAWSAVQNGDTA